MGGALPMIRVLGDATKGQIPMLHLVCEDCEALSSGEPNDAAQSVANHPTLRGALAAGWELRMVGREATYICPACRAKKGSAIMGKKSNGSSHVGTKEVEIKVALDPPVLEFKRNKLIDIERELDRLAAKKREVGAEWTSKLKDARETRAALLEELESGRQKMTVHVVEERDDRRGCMIVKRADNGAVVDERPYSAAERQLDLESTIRQRRAAVNTTAKPKRARKAKAADDEATA